MEVKLTGRTHEVKCWPASFAALREGFKTLELRFNDRGYCVGDILILAEWDPSPDDKTKTPFGLFRQNKGYTGQSESRVVTHVQHGFGLLDNFVALSLQGVTS